MEGAKRLVITEMLLENFKSYAGSQRVGPFHKCFSSVVGPNGSGKSNVIDAMLFVFGKRAKQLRLNKVSELIHNSTYHQNLDTAKVSVYFQEIIDTGEESFEVVPDSGFVVSRTAHRNNTSNYYIGNRKSNFSEVTDLLKGKGIDLDNNRFLILQGEVEQISMMKPKALTPHETGLLEYLEDIIGTDKYVEQIDAASKRLEEMNEARQSMVHRLKMVEREKENLEGARAAAEAYLDKDRECTEAQCNIYQLHVRDGTRNIGIIQTSLTELEAKLDYESRKMEGFAADQEEAETRLKAESKVHGDIQAELEKTRETFKGFERKDIKLKEDMKHLKAKLKKLGDKLTKDTTKAEEAGRKAEAADLDVPELTAKIEKLTKTVEREEKALEAMLQSTKGEEEALQKALQGVREKLAPWDKKIAGAQSRVDVATAERDLLAQQHADAQQRLHDAESGLEEAQAATTQKTSEISDMHRAVKTHRVEADAARQEAGRAAAEVSRLEAGLREVRGKLEQRRSDSNSQKSQSAIGQALMQAKASGKIPGIYGRLGDLGAIDKQYDIAISTACGALDNIVVEDTAAAQQCIELLRRQNLGVATFLLLDKQKHLARAAAEQVKPPEGVKRLFDLCKIRDNDLRCAFYYALRDTLVARDLEQASRIAYGSDKRWSRVVTLQGEMINETGTMTGGGGKPKGGRMCLGTAAPKSLDTRQAQTDLAEAESEFNVSKQALDRVKATAEAASSAVAKAEQKIAALEVKIPKTEMEVAAQQQKAADLTERLSELRKASKVGAQDAERLRDLDSRVKAAEKELGALQDGASGLQREAARLQKQIEDVGGEGLKKIRTTVTQLHADVATAEEELARRKVEALNGRKQADRLRKECAKTQKDKEKADADLEALSTSVSELEEAALKVLEEQQRIQALFEEKTEALAVITAEYEAKKKDVNTIRTVEIELQNKISDLRVSLDFENAAKKTNGKRADEIRKKLAEMAGNPKKLPPLLTEAELSKLVTSELEFRVTVLNEELARMSPDIAAIEAYRKKETDYQNRAQELESATAERDEVRKALEGLQKRRLDEFMASFSVISLKLKEMYQMITLGGDAELELVDSLNPFSEGIVFSVRPPKKSWKNIANLSGGEKTLSSLSLVFALHHYKPTPLYVMDEIDAALDFKNVSIVAHYIKDRTKNAQFIIISLRNNMFELADRLVGIYKTDNATKSVAINPGEFAVGKPSTANFQIGLPVA